MDFKILRPKTHDVGLVDKFSDSVPSPKILIKVFILKNVVDSKYNLGFEIWVQIWGLEYSLFFFFKTEAKSIKLKFKINQRNSKLLFTHFCLLLANLKHISIYRILRWEERVEKKKKNEGRDSKTGSLRRCVLSNIILRLWHGDPVVGTSEKGARSHNPSPRWIGPGAGHLHQLRTQSVHSHVYQWMSSGGIGTTTPGLHLFPY